MPITFDRDPSQDLTIFTLRGSVSFVEYVTRLAAYGKAGPTLKELYDARDLSGERFSRSDIETIAAYFKKFPDIRRSGSKTAVVVNADVDYGITRMISILTESAVSFEVNVFRSEDEARAWLNQ